MNVNLMIDGEIHTLTVTQVPFEYFCVASLLPDADYPLTECAFRASAKLSLDEAHLRWQEYHRAEYQEATITWPGQP